jgi:hypothetical protein
VPQVPQDRKVLPVHKESREQWVRRAQLVLQALQVHKAWPEQPAQLARKAFRDFKESQGQQEPQARQLCSSMAAS